MPSIWHLLSTLGDSRLLLPAAALLIGAGAYYGSRWHRRWAAGICLVASAVLVSKLAFLGWGIGSARWDFTGFSGHAAISASVWPMLLALLAPPRRWRWAAASGVLMAAAIAGSRLPLQAHSWSEVVTGWALGLLCTLWVVRRWQPLPSRRSAWAVAAVALGLCLPVGLPQASTHQLVVRMATALSGAAAPYGRSALRETSLTTPAREPLTSTPQMSQLP